MGRVSRVLGKNLWEMLFKKNKNLQIFFLNKHLKNNNLETIFNKYFYENKSLETLFSNNKYIKCYVLKYEKNDYSV
jgi:hypothetical protein